MPFSMNWTAMAARRSPIRRVTILSVISPIKKE
jgi:hypothetical protein